ncbi:TetR/AcrR family transcriptional regulator [Mycolicibacterium sp. 3033]|nr:TetR/AcrR family transcriptional regulator [Mycolicibacterium aurantiacum]
MLVETVSSAGERPRGRGRPVGADSENTRRGILVAARGVITERGYQAATFQQIAMRAGVSRPTLHYYFGSREQIYDVLLAEVHHAMMGCVAEAQQQVGLRDQLASFLGSLQRWSLEDADTLRFLVAARLEHHRGPHRAEAAARIFAAVHSFYDSVVVEAMRRGELPSDIDAAAVADMLAGLFWGAGFHAGFLRHSTSDHDASGVARQLLTLFESGLLESPVAAHIDA